LRQAATCHSVEHPFRNFQTAGRPIRRLSTSKCPRASPRHHIVDEHTQAKPGVPGIKYFPFLGPVGVMLSRCTTRFTRTRLSDIVRPVSLSPLTQDPDRVRSFGGYNTENRSVISPLVKTLLRSFLPRPIHDRCASRVPTRDIRTVAVFLSPNGCSGTCRREPGF